jgi:hypothetical protein
MSIDRLAQCVRSATLVILVAMLTACAAPVARQAMVPVDVAVASNHPYSILVRTSGGSETGAMDSSNISDADLKAAIEDSIARSRVFENVVQSGGGDYELNVRIVSLSKPLFGTTFTVDLETAWSLVKVSDRSIVMRRSFATKGVATMDEAFAGVTRLRLAVEKAARENVAQGLRAVGELKL